MASGGAVQESEYLILQKVIEDFPVGSLWTTIFSESEGTGTIIQRIDTEVVTPVNKDNYPHETFKRVQSHLFDLLLAVRNESDRSTVFCDKKWLEEGDGLQVGEHVTIQHIPDVPQGIWGTIRYKGSLQNYHRGTHFGIHLNEGYSGFGSSSGSFRRTKYFDCDEDCGLFLSIFFIRKKKHTLRSPLPRSPQGIDSTPPFFHTAGISQSLKDFSLQVDERVVWISDSGPEIGTVRWIGPLPDIDPHSAEKWYAGVAFDNPIGKGTGRYKGGQLFITEKDHASLVPVIGLLRLNDWKEAQSNQAAHFVHPEHQPTAEQGPPAGPGPAMPLPNFPDLVPEMRPEPTEMRPEPSQSTSKFSSRSEYYSATDSLEVSLHSDPPSNFPLPSTESQKARPSSTQYFSGSLEQDSSLDLHTATVDSKAYHVGDRVQVIVREPLVGTIRWLGRRDSSVVAGLEMDATDPRFFTDGTFEGRKVFDCQPYKAFFVYLAKCKHLDQRE